MLRKLLLLVTLSLFIVQHSGIAQNKPRARDLSIPFDGIPGPFDAITDVKGVEVGYVTLISGEGKLNVGVGPVRTGMTASCRAASSPKTLSLPDGLLSMATER